VVGCPFQRCRIVSRVSCAFILRMVIAQSTKTFLRRNWWQVLSLAVPFLRFLRACTRTAQFARAMSGSVRGARTATRTLTTRVARLVGLTIGVIVAGTQLLYEFGPTTSYAEALHDTTLASIAGEPIDADSPMPDVLKVGLAVYATIFFAGLPAPSERFSWIAVQRTAPKAIDAGARRTAHGVGGPHSLSHVVERDDDSRRGIRRFLRDQAEIPIVVKVRVGQPGRSGLRRVGLLRRNAIDAGVTMPGAVLVGCLHRGCAWHGNSRSARVGRQLPLACRSSAASADGTQELLEMVESCCFSVPSRRSTVFNGGASFIGTAEERSLREWGRPHT
jgi:hypothetical protein